MHCDVYDTYVSQQDGTVMHFDIIVPTQTTYEHVLTFGYSYLKQIGQENLTIETKLCRFCHIEQATPDVEKSIVDQGYFILAMEGCPAPANQQ